MAADAPADRPARWDAADACGEARGLVADAEPAPRHPAIHEIHCRTVLNRVQPPMPFRWSANPYRGCQHACAFGYARQPTRHCRRWTSQRTP